MMVTSPTDVPIFPIIHGSSGLPQQHDESEQQDDPEPLQAGLLISRDLLIRSASHYHLCQAPILW
jgi:hypothetical protein